MRISMKKTSRSLSHRLGGGLCAGVFIAILVMLGWCQSELSAQSPDALTVSGTVRSSVGEVVVGARVLLEEAGTSKSFEANTNADGKFAIVVPRAGTYTLRAEKGGMRARITEPFVLAMGEKKHFDLVLGSPSGGSSSASSPVMELKDEPDFTVAGVTDWSNVGLHGSDTTSRTSEALAKETLTLKPGGADKIAAGGRYNPALESMAKGDFAGARDEVRKLLAASDDAEGHQLLGDLDERLGDPLEAVREYERAARMHPSEQNYFDWGTELLLHKAAQPAVEVFTKGSGLHPGSARMLAGLGAALYGVGSYDEAARRLCAASDLRPDDPAPYLFLGQMERTVSEPLPCGEEKLARFAQVQPANARANYYYAVALWKRQRGLENSVGSRQAEALLEKAVRLDPNLGEAHVQLGILYFARNDFGSAIQAFQQAIKVSPQLSEAHYRLSLAYKRTGDEAKAREEFDAYQRAQKLEAAAVERQRGELKQFLIILKNQPGAGSSQ
jgi:tetratricopeptide (TPR) repeat protein